MKIKTHIFMVTLVSILLCGLVVADTHHSRRSYQGAPPFIPHTISESSKEMNCLSCHKYGGYSSKYKKDAPKTPHPTYINCIQCHVPKRTDSLFRKTKFEKWQNVEDKPVKTTPYAPPVIPHVAYERQNCASCHTSKNAVRPSTHPNRANCI